MARRLYASPLADRVSELALDDEARRHAQVLRLSEGDALRLFDGAGREAEARIVRVGRREIVCEVQPAELMPPPALKLQLALCVPKAAKLELIVRMVTELGVSAITLLDSERSVSKQRADAPKLERLRRITLEACAQSEQAYAPAITGPLPLMAALDAAPESAYKCAFLERSSTPLTAALPGNSSEVWALVGPEGGFAPEEAAQIATRAVALVSLGPAILRVETACVVACALLFDRLRARAIF